jgi:hypothetical protein
MVKKPRVFLIKKIMMKQLLLKVERGLTLCFSPTFAEGRVGVTFAFSLRLIFLNILIDYKDYCTDLDPSRLCRVLKSINYIFFL